MKLALFTAAIVSAFSLSAFANSNACLLPVDQGIKSFHGNWNKLPVRLVLDQEFYRFENREELRAVQNAVLTWNAWARSKGMVAFTFRNAGQGRPAPSVDSCSQADYTAAVTDAVGIWLIGGSAEAPNERPSCGSYQKLLSDATHAQVDLKMASSRIRGGSVLFNFDGRFGFDRETIDMESVALHSLGHLLGLNNSCNASSGDRLDSTGAVACSVAPAAYRKSVMSPLLSFGEKRRRLSANDIGRVNCLY